MKRNLSNDQQGTDEPLDMELSLSSAVIMLGEPLVLHYTVANAWPEVIDTYMGLDLEGWLTFHLVDAAGQDVPILSDPRVQNPGGMHTNGARISPHSYFRGYVVLSQCFAITQVGEHQLSIQVHLPYAPDERDSSVWPEHFEAVYGTVFRAEYSFPLTVTEANPARLNSLAESLASEFVQILPYSAPILIESLFSMSEEYALSSWKKVAQASGLSHLGTLQDTARELTRLNSITAADILLDMIWNPSQTHTTDGSRLSSGWSFLHNMYFSASPELQQHLQSMFREHGWAIEPLPRF